MRKKGRLLEIKKPQPNSSYGSKLGTCCILEKMSNAKTVKTDLANHALSFKETKQYSDMLQSLKVGDEMSPKGQIWRSPF